MGTYYGEVPATPKQIRYLSVLAARAGYGDHLSALAEMYGVSKSKAERRYLSMRAVSEAISALEKLESDG